MIELLGFLGAFGLVVFLFTVLITLNGFVLTVLWDWFVVPVFHIPSLSIAQAIGFGLVVTFMTYNHHKNVEPDVKAMLLRYPMVLIVGWVVHQFI